MSAAVAIVGATLRQMLGVKRLVLFGGLAVFISQSGETADTLAALRHARAEKQIILSIVKAVVSRTKNRFDDYLVENKVFSWLSHLAPVVVIYLWQWDSISLDAKAEILKWANVYMLIIGFMTVSSLLDAVSQAYRELWKNIARPSIDVFVEFDLADSKVVEIKGARIEVIEATGKRIRYRVLRAFHSK